MKTLLMSLLLIVTQQTDAPSPLFFDKMQTMHVFLGIVVNSPILQDTSCLSKAACNNYITRDAPRLRNSWVSVDRAALQLQRRELFVNIVLYSIKSAGRVCLCSSMSEYPTFQYGKSRFDQVLFILTQLKSKTETPLISVHVHRQPKTSYLWSW